MAVTYSEKAKQALGETQLARTNRLTAAVLDEYPYLPVRANWDVSEDAEGQFVYTVRADDPEESAREEVGPDELASDHSIRFHLYMLMGTLLRQRTNRLLRLDRKDGGHNGREN